jgi:multidrug resistance efflux pump
MRGVVVPGSSLFQLISTNEIWISSWVDETAATGLAVGQPARVLFRSEPATNYRGGVARLGRETDVESLLEADGGRWSDADVAGPRL